VEYGLAGAGAHIEDSAVTVLDFSLPRDSCCREMAAANDFGVVAFCLLQSREVTFRNYEHMHGCLGTNVVKGENVIVFIDFLRRDFAADDAAEKATRVSCHRFPATR